MKTLQQVLANYAKRTLENNILVVQINKLKKEKHEAVLIQSYELASQLKQQEDELSAKLFTVEELQTFLAEVEAHI